MDTLQIPGFDTLSTQLAQELYDPAKRLNTDPSLAHTHEAFAAFILDLYGIAPDTSGTLLSALACDAVESALDTEDKLVARAEDVVDVQEFIVPSIEELVDRTQEQARALLKQIDIEAIPEEKRTVYASVQIAQASYSGKARKTGERYYEHPKRAAAMALHLFNRLEEEDQQDIEPAFKDAVVCAALLHDATEETIRSCKYYDPNRPKGFSPLLVREVFRQTDNPYGYMVANSLRLMTHYAKHEWAPDYAAYVDLGSDDLIFDLVKTLDMGDNLLHPKPITESMSTYTIEKIARKRALYTKMIGKMAIDAIERTDSTSNPPWIPRYFELFNDISADDMPEMIREFNKYIYNSEDEPVYESKLRPGSPVIELTFPNAA